MKIRVILQRQQKKAQTKMAALDKSRFMEEMEEKLKPEARVKVMEAVGSSMKTQTVGISSSKQYFHSGIHGEGGKTYIANKRIAQQQLESAMGTLRSQAVAAYKANRLNGTDVDSTHVMQQDGKYEVKMGVVYCGKDRNDNYCECTVQYIPGPGDLAYMKEMDRDYIARLEREWISREIEQILQSQGKTFSIAPSNP